MLNDRVLPFFEEHGVPLLRILTDRGSEYCSDGCSSATQSSSPREAAASRRWTRPARTAS